MKENQKEVKKIGKGEINKMHQKIMNNSKIESHSLLLIINNWILNNDTCWLNKLARGILYVKFANKE